MRSIHWCINRPAALVMMALLAWPGGFASAQSAPCHPPCRTIPLSTAAPVNVERAMVAGLPLPAGQLRDSRYVRVMAGDRAVPSQIDATAKWPDGSVKWLLARFLPPGRGETCCLVLGEDPGRISNPFDIRQTSEELSVGNGRLHLRMRRDGFALFQQVSDTAGAPWTGEPLMGNLRVVDAAGDAWGAAPPERLVMEESGPVQAVVCAEGPLHNDRGESRYRYRIRYFLTAGSPLVRAQITLINDAARPEFARLASFALRVPLSGDGPLQGQLAGGDPVVVTAPDRNHIEQQTDRRELVTVDGVGAARDGRSTGWAVAQRGNNRIAVLVRDFWQTWPKGIALEPDGLHVRLLPSLAKDEYHAINGKDWVRHLYWFDKGTYLFKRGMALRSEVWLRFDHASDPVPGDGWEAWSKSVLSLPYAASSPEDYCASGAFGPLSRSRIDQFGEYERMVERQVQAVLHNREADGEYGWMNFGDWHGEREYNWGNSEYDWSWAMACHFARTGRWDYFELGEQMARHYTTIDTAHVPFEEQMKGRAYKHCVGHIGVGVMPGELGVVDDRLERWLKDNRSYARGGFDAAGHIYQEGNFAYYFLTGDRDYLDAAEMVVTAQAEYLAPKFDFTIERAAGWPLINAVAAYESTGKPLYLKAARLYVDKILAKQDPVDGGWLLPQSASECPDGTAGIGGKAFATGVLLYGLMRYDLIEPRAEVKTCITRACGWLVTKAWHKDLQGFRYKTGCAATADSVQDGSTTALCLPGLAYGWELSGDARFAEVLRIGFTQMCRETAPGGKDATQYTRQSAFALPALLKLGLSTLPSTLPAGQVP